MITVASSISKAAIDKLTKELMQSVVTYEAKPKKLHNHPGACIVGAEAEKYFDPHYFASMITKEFGLQVTRLDVENSIMDHALRVRVCLWDGMNEFQVNCRCEAAMIGSKIPYTDMLFHMVRGYLKTMTDEKIDCDNPQANYLRDHLHEVPAPGLAFDLGWRKFLYCRGLRPDWKSMEVWFTPGLVQLRGHIFVENKVGLTKVIREIPSVNDLSESVYGVMVYLMNEVALEIIRYSYKLAD